MFHNIKCLSLHRVFHGIRFKVNEDWESGKIPFFCALPFSYSCGGPHKYLHRTVHVYPKGTVQG